MTKNQLEYWSNQETKRHNLAMEQQGLLQLEELRRSNMANERNTYQSISETERANRAREAEARRNNMANEANQLLNVQTRQQELAELIRANQANEALGRLNASIASYNAATNRMNAITQANNVEYNYSLGLKSQFETNRSNVANEAIKANQNPWTSIATTMNKITASMPSVSQMRDSLTTNLSRLGTTVSSAVSKLTPTSAPKATTTKSVVASSSNNPVRTSNTKANYKYSTVHYTGRGGR